MNGGYKNGEVPYMDTFYKYKIADGKLNLMTSRYRGSSDGSLYGCHGRLGNCCTCVWCEDNVDEDDITDVGGDDICDSCLDSEFTLCRDCNNYFVNENCTYIAAENKNVCRNCVSNYPQCSDCDEHNPSRDMVVIDGNSVCQDCLSDYNVCADCDKYFDEVTPIQNTDKQVCDNCLHNYTECCECGDYFTIYGITTADNKTYCNDCRGYADCKGQILLDLDDMPKKNVDKIEKLEERVSVTASMIAGLEKYHSFNSHFAPNWDTWRPTFD